MAVTRLIDIFFFLQASLLASNIYFPAINAIANDLNVSVELVNLSITAYLLFQGLAPSLWGPISDVQGRRTAYACTLLVLVGACIGLARTTNYVSLVVLRCLQSTGSASTVAIGSGVIGDITTRADRGGYMGIFQGGMLIPIAIAPVIGGLLSGFLGWKSIFWFLTIYSGVLLLLVLVSLPETNRSIVANGTRRFGEGTTRFQKCFLKYPLGVYQRFSSVLWDPNLPQQLSPRKKIDFLGPIRILIRKETFPIVFFFSVYFAVWQMSVTAICALFQERYHLTEIQTGLTFIANGVGSTIGTLITGKLLDKDYQKVQIQFQQKRQNTNIHHEGFKNPEFPLEKARLRLCPVFALLQCLSILLFAWSIQFSDRVHIAVPIASTFITGWTSVSTQSIVTTYLVDIYPDNSAAATASLNMARCGFAAGGTSFIMPLVGGVGVGVAFTICAIVQVIAMVGLFVQWRFAERWRMKAGR